MTTLVHVSDLHFGRPAVAERLDALREFDRDETLKDMLGREFSAAFVKLKTDEWNDYMAHFSEWERANTLDI